nr:hypothetical protein [Pseudomonas syringae pv. actinidiae]
MRVSATFKILKLLNLIKLNKTRSPRAARFALAGRPESFFFPWTDQKLRAKPKAIDPHHPMLLKPDFQKVSLPAAVGREFATDSGVPPLITNSLPTPVPETTSSSVDRFLTGAGWGCVTREAKPSLSRITIGRRRQAMLTPSKTRQMGKHRNIDHVITLDIQCHHINRMLGDFA